MKSNWKSKPLGEVATVGAGNPAPQAESLFENGTYPFFRTADAGKVRFGSIYESSDYLNEKGIKGLRLSPKGTILLPKSGASTFLNHRVMLGVDGYVSSHLATILANESVIDSRYLLFFLSTISAQDLIQDHAYPSLNLDVISSITVSFPSLPEQQRIVKILDKAFEGLATAKANAEKNLLNARALFESYLNSVFTKHGEGWEEKSLGDTFITVTGSTPPKNMASYYGNYMPFVKPPELLDDNIDSAADNLSEKGTTVARTLPIKSVLVSCIGNLGKIGFNVVPVAFNQQINAILPQEELAIPEFMFFQTLSMGFRNRLERMSSGTTVPIVNKSRFNSIKIVLPPLAEQKAIVSRIKSLREETRLLERAYQSKMEKVEALKKSLLHQAFQGEL